MKPRQWMPMTEDDLEAWGLVCERFVPRSACYWYERVLDSDRRDAELMLLALSPCPICGKRGAKFFNPVQEGAWVRWPCGNIATRVYYA